MLLVVVAILVAFVGWFGKRGYTDGNRKLNHVCHDIGTYAVFNRLDIIFR